MLFAISEYKGQFILRPRARRPRPHIDDYGKYWFCEQKVCEYSINQKQTISPEYCTSIMPIYCFIPREAGSLAAGSCGAKLELILRNSLLIILLIFASSTHTSSGSAKRHSEAAMQSASSSNTLTRQRFPQR